MELLRKTYQRAIALPIGTVESIWKEYDAFENSLNRVTGKKLITEKSPIYMTARTALREMKSALDGVDRSKKGWVVKPVEWTERECSMVCFK